MDRIFLFTKAEFSYCRHDGVVEIVHPYFALNQSPVIFALRFVKNPVIWGIWRGKGIGQGTHKETRTGGLVKAVRGRSRMFIE